jgi:hypothetical protein
VTEQGRLMSLLKSELKEWSVASHSPMPSAKDMPADTLADLMAYLMSLTGTRQ